MPDLLKDFDTSEAPRIKLAQGVVSRVVGDDIYAILPSFNQRHEFGPMKISGPAVGDKILVAFDEQGTPWVAAWHGVYFPIPSPLVVDEIDFVGVGGVPGQVRLIHAGFSEGLMIKTNDWPYLVFSPDVDSGAGFGLYPHAADNNEGWEVYVEAGTQDAIHFWSNTVGMDAIRVSMPGQSAKISFGAWVGGGPIHDTEVHRRAAGILAIGANDIIVANDPRLTDARFPTAHQYTHTPGGADVVTAMGVLDSRATEEAPYASATYRQSFRAELKQRASITGTPGTGTYGVLVTHSPWYDDSGGGVKQTWWDDSNPPRMFVRRGTIAGGWSAWVEMASLASPTFTGTPSAPTPSAADNTTKIATTAFVQGEIAAKAPLASPTFTGDPKAPTPSAGDSDTSIATTAFVQAAIVAAGKKLKQIDVITSGTSYTAPSGATALFIEAVGGGGGGGGGVGAGVGQLAIGSGGGGGAYASKWLTTNIGTHAVVIGAGGTGSIGANGTAGGDTSFKDSAGTTICLAKGGGGGDGSGAVTVARAVSNGGVGGAAASCTGDTKIDGGHGEGGVVVTTSNANLGASGGAGGMGGGGGGFRKYGTGDVDGAAGSANTGGGGGGALVATGAFGRSGGGGGSGFIRVWVYA